MLATRWLLLTLALLAGASATAGTLREIPAGEAGVLQIEIDDEWKETRVPRGAMAALAVESREPRRMALLVSGLPSDRRGDGEIRGLMQRMAERIATQAVEKSLPLQPMKGEHVSGYYVFATDAAPKPGEFLYMHQGAVAVGPLLVTFTLLTNDGAERDTQAALAALRGMRFKPSPTPR